MRAKRTERHPRPTRPRGQEWRRQRRRLRLPRQQRPQRSRGPKELFVRSRPSRRPEQDSCRRGALARSAARIRFYEVVHVIRSEEHTSELQSLMRISYAVFCLKKKKISTTYRILIIATNVQ